MIIAEVMKEQRATVLANAYKLSNPSLYFGELFSGISESTSGAKVSDDTAKNVAAVFACMTVIAGTLGTVPLPFYRRLLAGGKERAREHQLYEILHDQPNPEMTSVEWREAMQGWLVLRGNCASEIEWGNDGQVNALWPLPWDKVFPRRVNNKIWYEIHLANGSTQLLPQERIFHIRGMGSNGLVGFSPLEIARDVIGASLSADEYAARFFKNDATPGGFLTHPKTLTDAAHKRLIQSYENRHTGLSQKHRLQILEEGMQWQQAGLQPRETQFLEQRKFQIREICRIFNMKPHMIADLDNATFSNIEQQSIEFVRDTMRPWFVRWEQAIRRSLILPGERQTYFAKFVIDGLLRGDTLSRYSAHKIAKDSGWMNADEIREIEDMNPVPEGKGKIYTIPLNMIPVDQIVKQDDVDKESEPEPEPEKKTEQRIQWSVVATSYRRLFEDAMGRVVRREKADIMRFANKILGGNGDAGDLIKFCDTFFENHKDYVQKQLKPIIFSYIDTVQATISESYGREISMTPELEKVANDYTEEFSRTYSLESHARVKEAIMNDQPTLSELDTLLESCVRKIPIKIAKSEPEKIGRIIEKIIKQGGLSNALN